MQLHQLLLAIGLAGCLGNDTPVSSADGQYNVVGDLAPLCSGNNDGVIARSELIFPVGATVRYLDNPAGTTVTVNPDGTMGASGVTWDLTLDDPNDVALDFTLQPVAGAWWAASFPSASYAALSDTTSGILGVYEVTADSVLLLGFVSPTPNDTLLVYDAPIATLRFPLSEGMAWVTGARITNGRLAGQPFASKDDYQISVDAEGSATLPFLKFDNTLRVHVELTQALPGGISVHTIQHIFMHECYGELGRMASQRGETNPSFTTAAEFRRLAL